jgi:hypothetical protein
MSPRDRSIYRKRKVQWATIRAAQISSMGKDSQYQLAILPTIGITIGSENP